MSRTDWAGRAFSFVAGALVATAALVVGDGPLVFRPELALGDLLGAAVAIGLGYYVGHLLRVRGDRRRIEIDRLVRLTEDVLDRAASLRSKQERLLKDEVEVQEVVAEAHTLAGDIAGLKSKMRIYELLDDLAPQFSAVESALSNYRLPIGESRHVPNPPAPPEYDRLYRALTDELDRLIRDTNRLD